MLPLLAWAASPSVAETMIEAETTTEDMFWGFDFSLRKEDMLPT